MGKVEISCIQLACKPINSFEDFRIHVEDLLDETNSSDFVLFPELFTMELQYLIPDRNLLRISEFTDVLVELFKHLSEERDQHIIGSHVTRDGDRHYNTAFVFSPEGDVLEHRKTHLFSLERHLFFPGDKVEIFETEKAKIGVAVCYEMEFPELVRVLTLKGAEIVFCPSYTVGEHAFWRVRHCCHARAVENQIYVALSHLVGIPAVPELAGRGKSAIISPCEEPWPPDGVVVEAEANKEVVITAKLDLKSLHEKRKSGVATTLKDRRPELYNC
jgi:predicted amidohydrolase